MTLQELTEAIHQAKFKDMPHCETRKELFPTKPFTEKGANELTRAIEAFIRYTGNYADRINNTGSRFFDGTIFWNDITMICPIALNVDTIINGL